MEYDFNSIEQKWQQLWNDRQQYAVSEATDKPKYYVLDMFPYPSGAGLHVGHPLGYIASDIFARYKKHKGFNVLHPMGYDSFGLPAEQYAIETGQHPALTTEQNISRYREQLDKLGFAYDWSREVRTSEPNYYRWTQWIFAELFNAWYNTDTNKAEPIATLIAKFEENGTYNVNAAVDENWFSHIDKKEFPQFSNYFSGEFTATDWASFTERQKQLVLMHFRLTYLADSVVNWCPALGTVLANDEVVNGRSERGGHPVEQKLMRQWMMRITAYAERLLNSLDTIDWSDSLKEIQRNWIGRSEGARVRFAVDGFDEEIEVFTTRPDTIFGVDFMVLAPEHALVKSITTSACRPDVDAYVKQAAARSERERMGDVKQVSGCFTGGYALHPLTGRKLPVYIADYVLASYGTGAIMAVPAGDERDWRFAQHFEIAITSIFEGVDVQEGVHVSTETPLVNSDFLNGMNGADAKRRAIEELEKGGVGSGTINYRLRDAVFSRQRYWGEPFPVYYPEGVPALVKPEDLPVTLPDVDKYLPTESGEPPLARAADWTYENGALETNTMPGWAGSSWYFLRYMDPHNDNEFCAREKSDYWGQVDFYMGGAEHATGHLLYSRFWTKVLFDLGHIGFDEPFKKLVNQGMIQGRSSFVWRALFSVRTKSEKVNSSVVLDQTPKTFISHDLIQYFGETNSFECLESLMGNNQLIELIDAVKQNVVSNHVVPEEDFRLSLFQLDKIHVDISLVNNDRLNTEGFKQWRSEYANAEFITNDEGEFVCDWEVEKMSKSKYNVQTPDELVEKYGADTLRCYEMFLGPVEQHKPWDTNGINGVHNFLRKLWRLYHNSENAFAVSDAEPTADELRTLHKTIKKVTEDLERLSWNTVVSAMMICVNELTEQKCNKRAVLEVLPVLLSPYAPHVSEELWERLGKTGSVTDAAWPVYDEAHLKASSITYPVQFNGKVRYNIEVDPSMPTSEVEKVALNHERAAQYLDGKAPRKVIVVPGRIVNVVV